MSGQHFHNVSNSPSMNSEMRLSGAGRGGKSIGGSLGGPQETSCSPHDISFHRQDLEGKPEPNDDLEFQQVWRPVLKQYGTSKNNES